jgi:hypothetical protein
MPRIKYTKLDLSTTDGCECSGNYHEAGCVHVNKRRFIRVQPDEMNDDVKIATTLHATSTTKISTHPSANFPTLSERSSIFSREEQPTGFLSSQKLLTSHSAMTHYGNTGRETTNDQKVNALCETFSKKEATVEDIELQTSKLHISSTIQPTFPPPSSASAASNSSNDGSKRSLIVILRANALKAWTPNSIPNSVSKDSTKISLNTPGPVLIPTERGGRIFLKLRLNGGANLAFSPAITQKSTDGRSKKAPISATGPVTPLESKDEAGNPINSIKLGFEILNDSSSIQKRKLLSLSDTSRLSTPPSASSSVSFRDLIDNEPIVTPTTTTPAITQTKSTLESIVTTVGSPTKLRTPKKARTKPAHDKDGVPLHPNKRSKQVTFTRSRIPLHSSTTLSALRESAPELDYELANIILGPSLTPEAQWMAMSQAVRREVLNRIRKRLHTFDAGEDWFSGPDEWREHVLQYDSISIHAQRLLKRRVAEEHDGEEGEDRQGKKAMKKPKVDHPVAWESRPVCMSHGC